MRATMAVAILVMLGLAAYEYLEGAEQKKSPASKCLESIARIRKRAINHNQVFAGLQTQYVANVDETNYAAYLGRVCENTSTHANYLEDFGRLYERMVCQQDKNTIAELWKWEIGFYKKAVKFDFQHISTNGNATRVPSMALEARELRKTIEEFVDVLSIIESELK